MRRYTRGLGHLGIALLLATTGCPGDHGHDPTPSTANESTHSHEGSHEVGLELNAGKKWKMDDHTRTVFAELRRSIDGGALSSTKDVTDLGVVLDGHLKTLIAGCTMTGEAHDQLHVFLTRFMPAVEAFSQESDLAKARAALQNLQHQLVEYDKFFE